MTPLPFLSLYALELPYYVNSVARDHAKLRHLVHFVQPMQFNPLVMRNGSN